MAQITINEKLYHSLLAVAAERGASPEEIIAAGIQALDDHRVTTSEPMMADEFAAALGMSPEDVTRADAEARKRYPEAFGQ
jgi:hypothetical protein